MALLSFCASTARADQDWDGDSPFGNFNSDINWFGNSQPGWSATANFNLNYNNGSASSLYDDYTYWVDTMNMYYKATFPSSMTLSGAGPGINIHCRLQNDCASAQTISIPLSMRGDQDANTVQINPVNGDLTLNGALYNDNTKDLHVYGNNGKTLTLNTAWPAEKYGVKLIIHENSIVKITAAQNYTLNTDINAGELRIGSGGSLASANVNVGTYSTPTITAKLWIESADLTLDKNIFVNYGNSGTRVVGGLNESGTATFSGGLTLGGDVNLSAAGDGSVLFGGNITEGSGKNGGFGITKVGSGTVLLGGVNTYDGVATVSTGTLLAGKPEALPFDYIGVRCVSVASGATLAVMAGGSGEWGTTDIDSLLDEITVVFSSVSKFGIEVSTGNSFTYAGNIGATQVGKGFVKSGAGTLTLSGVNTYSGVTTISAGELRIGSGCSLDSANIHVGNSSTLATTAKLLMESGWMTLSGNINVKAGNANTRVVGGLNTSGTATFSGELALDGDVNLSAESGGNVVFSGKIWTGAKEGFSITKVGLGTVELNNSENSYAGGSTISAGKLLVNNTSGSGTGSGAVTVNSGGTLGGEGAITGPVTVKTGGDIAPGNSIGTLNTGNVTFENESQFICEIGSPSSLDKIAANGMLRLPSGAEVMIIDIAGALLSQNESYDVITYTSRDMEGGDASNIDVINNPSSYGIEVQLIESVKGGSTVRLLTLPEPGVLGLAGLALVGIRTSLRLKR